MDQYQDCTLVGRTRTRQPSIIPYILLSGLVVGFMCCLEAFVLLAWIQSPRGMSYLKSNYYAQTNDVLVAIHDEDHVWDGSKDVLAHYYLSKTVVEQEYLPKTTVAQDYVPVAVYESRVNELVAQLETRQQDSFIASMLEIAWSLLTL